MKKSVILDVDTGIDDGVAIMLGALSKKIDIKLICTCFGNTTAENSATNTANLLSYLNIHDAKIAIGSKDGLVKSRQNVNVHGKNGLGDYPFPKNNYSFSENYLEEYKNAILENAGKTHILVLGPLTNVAKLLLKAPEVKEKIAEIVFMGSSLAEYKTGEVPYPGFNVACDPEATEVVLNSGVPVVFCPNDLGKVCKISPNELELVKNTNKTGKMLFDIFNAYKDRQVVDGIAMYDSTTIYYFLEPKNVEVRPVNIEIKYFDELGTGVAIADFDKEPNAKMMTSINIKKFKKYCFKALKTIK